MSVWRFTVQGDVVSMGERQRVKISATGCNEPFKGRYWCPKRQWFSKEACPFVNLRECEIFETMCGAL